MAARTRHDGRTPAEMRPVRITPGFVGTADGSCLIELGGTRVICTASFESGAPDWRAGRGMGWVTGEYGMLPGSTGRRKRRTGPKGDSRGTEIKRLIGRCLRAAVRMDRLGENTVTIDCDVLEADGGTRTAAVTGGWVALAMALDAAADAGRCLRTALRRQIAAVSVGIVDGQAVQDLDYPEDASAEVDMNVAGATAGKLVELQATGERGPFAPEHLDAMLRLARRGIRAMLRAQKDARKGYDA